MTVRASCHCGNVQIKIQHLVAVLHSCNCSICHRYAALWGFHKVAQVFIEVGDFALSRYRWGDEMIDFYFCSHCGSTTHYLALKKSKIDRLAINYRLFEPDIYKDLAIKKIDGASF
ncbi:MAG: hypothetical protein Q9M92_05060 [Enterobacterales bacterium]|nr:hypothetical protein [Enterobacterales bacterium]